MTKNQFEKLTGFEYIQPNYTEKSAYKIKSINKTQGIIELYEKRYISDTQFYRYENVEIVKLIKAVDNDTFEDNIKLIKIYGEEY